MKRWMIYLAAVMNGHSLSAVARAAEISATAVLKSTSGMDDPSIGGNAEERREYYWNSLTPEERHAAAAAASDLMAGIPLNEETNMATTKSKLTIHNVMPTNETADKMMRAFLNASGLKIGEKDALPKSAKDILEAIAMVNSDLEKFTKGIADEIRAARAAYVAARVPAVKGMAGVMAPEAIAAPLGLTVDEVRAILAPTPAPQGAPAPTA